MPAAEQRCYFLEHKLTSSSWKMGLILESLALFWKNKNSSSTVLADLIRSSQFDQLKLDLLQTSGRGVAK